MFGRQKQKRQHTVHALRVHVRVHVQHKNMYKIRVPSTCYCEVIRYVYMQVYGVKGLSWLSTIPYFDTIRGFSVDYMHCVLLGVCRQLLKLWLKRKNHRSLWYIGNHVSKLDKRLLAIRPLIEMQRTPRSMEHTIKFWKGILCHFSAFMYLLIIDTIQHMNSELGCCTIPLLCFMAFCPGNTINTIYCLLRVSFFC